jgi:hypothetical protein
MANKNWYYFTHFYTSYMLNIIKNNLHYFRYMHCQRHTNVCLEQFERKKKLGSASKRFTYLRALEDSNFRPTA